MLWRPIAVRDSSKLDPLMLCALLAATWTGPDALAESATGSGGTGGVASARLEFRLNVPKFLRLQVGATGATVDQISMAPTPRQIATTPSTAVAGTGGQGGGSVAIAVQATPGADAVNLTFNTTDATGAGRPALSDGASTVPWSTIKVSTSGADAARLAHPPTLADGSVSDVSVAVPVPKVSGIIDLRATWTYSWDDGGAIHPASGPGGYTGRVAYKLSTP